MTEVQLREFNRIKAMDKLFVNSAEIAPILECNPNDLRGQAHDRPELLGFPVVVCGTRVRFPRLPFIQFIEELPCCCPATKSKVIQGEAS